MGTQLKKISQYHYLNKMEISQSLKKRYSLGVEVDNCPGTAAGVCVDGKRYRT